MESRRLARVLAAAAVAALGAAAPARATIIPIAQTRTASAGGGATVDDVTISDSRTRSAPGFGSWSDSAGVAVRNDPATLDAFASQSSTITPTVVEMSGLADAFAETGGFDQQASGNGNTVLRLSFDVAIPTAFQLDAIVTSIGSGYAAFELIGPGVLIQTDPFGTSEYHDVVQLGVGSYALEARLSAGVFAAHGSSSAARSTVDFRFSQVPEPATALLVIAATAGLAALERRRGMG